MVAVKMRRQCCFIYVLVTLQHYYMATCAAGAATWEEQKAEAAVPMLTPPEGNTTFVGGNTWCVALAGVAESDLQTALDWACGQGAADCAAVRAGGPCFEPDTLLSHASFAFNSYYQQNGNSDIACNFGGTATITQRNPSYGSCSYLSSEPTSTATLVGRRDITATMFLLGLLLAL